MKDPTKRSIFGRRSGIPYTKVTSSWFVNLFAAMYYICLILMFRRRYIINPSTALVGGGGLFRESD